MFDSKTTRNLLEPVNGATRPQSHSDAEQATNPRWGRLATGVGLRLQRDADASGSAKAPAPLTNTAAPYGVIVEDDAIVSEGQIAKTIFLQLVETEVTSQAEQRLTQAGKTAKDCPYIDHWINYYSSQSAARVERAIARFARPDDISTQGLHDAVVQRVARGVDTWIESGFAKVDSPEGVNTTGDDDGISDPETPSPELQSKAVEGFANPPAAGDPAAIQDRLGGGQPLPGRVRSRMERGFGKDFGDVRFHDGRTAAHLAEDYSARAFTVGHDVAFAAGQYQPGTLVGDLLIAHELAHVVQQRGGGRTSGLSQSTDSLETNADEAALAVVNRISPEQGLDEDFFAMPSVSRSGLRLQRCKDCGSSNPAIPAWWQEETKDLAATTVLGVDEVQLIQLQQLLRQIDVHLWFTDGETVLRTPGKGKAKKKYSLGHVSVTQWTSVDIKSKLAVIFPPGVETTVDENVIAAVKKVVAEDRKAHPNAFSMMQGIAAANSPKCGSKPDHPDCIMTLNMAVQKLYGSRTVRVSDLGDDVPATISTLDDKKHLVSDKKVINAKYNTSPLHYKQISGATVGYVGDAPGAWIFRSVSAEKEDGVFAFVLSIAKGYHSVMILALKTGTDVKLVWKDQNQADVVTDLSAEELSSKLRDYLAGRFNWRVKELFQRKFKTEITPNDSRIPEVEKTAEFDAAGDIKETIIAKLKPSN